MSEMKLTGIFAGVALVLAVIAWAVSPGRVTPEAFMDQGELFFPEFTDPNQATSLEVIEFDQNAGTAKPFKVEFKNGRWTIPSHHGYPADGQDRLAKTAAGVIDIRKDDFRTNLVADHEACGVIDPLDAESLSLTGRGNRVTLRGSNGETLADFIVGKEVPDRAGFRFVRIPDQNRVYASKMALDISTNFTDWIKTSLLEVKAKSIDRIMMDYYSINEQNYSIQAGERIDLRRRDNSWTSSSLAGAQLDTTKVKQLTDALEGLNIVGVRPKPEGLSEALKSSGKVEMSQSDQMSLQNKGFYLARQDGRLLSNEGELKAYTDEGVVYTLRFGEVLYGSGLAVTAGVSDNADAAKGGQQQANRYMFLTAEFNEDRFLEPKRPSSLDFQGKADSLWTDFDRTCKTQYDAHQQWERSVQKGRDLASSLNARFADWYYVISEDSFKKIHLGSKDLKKS
jgi:hypothetical protein